MTSDFPRVWTPEQIAEMTQIDVSKVLVEIKTGKIPSFQIGDEYRVTNASLLAFMKGAPIMAGDNPQDYDKLAAEWNTRAKFKYLWPDGKTKEPYDTAYETDVSLPSGQHHFVIGYTDREAAGMKDRRRVIVFLGQVPKIVPVVEFTGANDFAKTKRLVSIIKYSTNKHVRTQAQMPKEYQGIPTAIYSDVVIGPYAARSLAVLANNDDRDLMLRHAIIRARYKGWC